MTVLWLDYETRSYCDLLKRGVYNYAQDKTTEVLIASYAIDNGPIKRWEHWRGKPMPAQLNNALANPKVIKRAHNAGFERLISQHVLGITTNAWECTSFQARCLAMPAGLDDWARMVMPSHRKDPRGNALIRAHSIPPYDDNPDGLTMFGVYCDRDVEVMRALSSNLPQPRPEDQRVYQANETINDRGLLIDTELCDLALAYADREAQEAEVEIRRLTQGAITKARGTSLTRWIRDRLPEDVRPLMGEPAGLGAAVKASLLELGPDAIGQLVYDVIECSDAFNLASVAKFGRLKNLACADGRLRGAFVAAGAGQTGRYASWGAQLHNFPRSSAKDPEAIKKRMKRGDTVSMQELKSMLRPAIVAPRGKQIVRCDWNAIEARGLPWLVDTPAAREYLNVFTDPSRDIYVEQAQAAGLKERQEGKVIVLSLGYGGSVGALTSMCKAYGVTIERPAPVVSGWRRANTWAVQWWQQLIQAAGANKGGFAGRIRIDRVAGLGLTMLLPSGRRLYYPGAHVSDAGELVYKRAARKPKATEIEWPLHRLWHGILAENATQAVCCDLLRDFSVEYAEHEGFLGHIHDETIFESGETKRFSAWLKKAMTAGSPWAVGFPLAAKVEYAPRFGK